MYSIFFLVITSLLKWIRPYASLLLQRGWSEIVCFIMVMCLKKNHPFFVRVALVIF